ncbi:hypothetical protein V1264_010234 [Littorina saxatilis]|uniref:UDP-glucuronic acid decarboxylase 1 n=3 Tax=Littorina saxatilis TaxID=31220 RepID=A0AAN9G0M6_9CAEN
MDTFTNSKEKRILVTGGAGFLGSHLVDHLMEAGHQVIVADNFFTGHKDNLQQWLHHPRFSLIEHDITKPLDLQEVDEMYHLACPASPPVYMANPVFTITTNTVGTLNMLELAKKTGAKILLASTSEIYGDPQVVPQTEEYWGHVNPVGSRASYDVGKRAAEAMFTSYYRQFNIPIRIARISNSYGPRLPEDGGGVVGSFIKQALANKPIYVYGDGNQTRCLQHVSDAVKGIVKLMESDYTHPVNIAGTERFTIMELAQLIKSLIETSSEIVKKEPRQDDPRLRQPDITKAKTILNWEPQVPLKEGIKPTIEYFRQQLRNNNVETGIS